jgi:putative transposase
VNANQAELPVQAMCHHLNVSTSGYYAWRGRAPAKRAVANATLIQQIREVFAASDETYGMPRVRAQLAHQGVKVSRNRVAHLMATSGLRGVSRRRAWVATTKRDKRQRPAPDLVKREFVATAINQLWVADMTYIPTWVGFLYLAVVIDVYSRKVVGWAFGQHMTADLVVAALNMALFTRKPGLNGPGVIHHSDQGSQYTSIAFGTRCKEMNVRPSMGTVGDAYDNAMAESFFASLECELIDRRCWQTLTQARLEVFTWIESWYNPKRLHSKLGYLSPIDFERKQNNAQEDTKPTNNMAAQHGLPTGCFAPVDKPPQLPVKGTSPCPQASPVDNPAPAQTHTLTREP